jgi:hypothetical protein
MLPLKLCLLVFLALGQPKTDPHEILNVGQLVFMFGKTEEVEKEPVFIV